MKKTMTKCFCGGKNEKDTVIFVGYALAFDCIFGVCC